MDNNQIRRQAVLTLRNNYVEMIVSSFYIFTILLVALLIEWLIFYVMQIFGNEYQPLNVNFYLKNPNCAILLAVRLLIYYIVLTARLFSVRRNFIDISGGSQTVKRYMTTHFSRVVRPGVMSALKLFAYKLLVLSPVSVGIYGIMYYYRLSGESDISMFGLVCFMLSIGFSIVWTGVCIHYFISLSLVRYITELNPRANFFDACDLSVKLMDGQHYRVVMMYASLFLRGIPCIITIYPMLLFVPYFIECRLILAKDIMGSYWQDKLPAMARRWEKQQERKGA